MQQQTLESKIEAAQVRVTPHELAQATAIIEARQEAQARHLADTIALGQAVQQLGLAATPEELLAEVQALRANAQQAETSRLAKKQQAHAARTANLFRWKSALPLSGLALLVTIILALLPTARRQWLQAHSGGAGRTLPVVVTSIVHAQASTSQADGFWSLDLKEGQTAQCSADQVISLAHGANPAQLWAGTHGGNGWQLTRLAGKFWVKCWASRFDAAQISGDHRGYSALSPYARYEVFNTQHSGIMNGKKTVPAMLQLEMFRNTWSAAVNGEDIQTIAIQSVYQPPSAIIR